MWHYIYILEKEVIIFVWFFYFLFFTFLGKNYLQWHGPEAEFVITEPDLIKEVLNNGNRAYPKAETKGFMKKLLGDGLLTTEGEKWAKLRKLANYAFHAESLKVYNFYILEYI